MCFPDLLKIHCLLLVIIKIDINAALAKTKENSNSCKNKTKIAFSNHLFIQRSSLAIDQ